MPNRDSSLTTALAGLNAYPECLEAAVAKIVSLHRQACNKKIRRKPHRRILTLPPRRPRISGQILLSLSAETVASRAKFVAGVVARRLPRVFQQDFMAPKPKTHGRNASATTLVGTPVGHLRCEVSA